MIIIEDVRRFTYSTVAIDMTFMLFKEIKRFKFENTIHEILVGYEDITIRHDVFNDVIFYCRFWDSFCTLIKVQFLS